MMQARGSERSVVVAVAMGLCLLLSVPPSTADTGVEETVYYGERCFDWNEEYDGYCPASSEADSYLESYQDPDDCPIIEVEEGSRYSGTECCYDVVMEACYDYNAGGCLDKF
ncbi:MAG: hypothetical protein ACI8RZ_003114 [Myxococcota bacterium]|jgi:hypothetical protein